MRTEEGEMVGYVPDIPRTMWLPHESKRAPNCFREHGFTVLVAMIGKILLTPVQGRTESIIPIERFWNVIEPSMSLLTRVWEKYEAISREDDPMRKSKQEEASYNSLTEYLFGILKSKYAKEVDDTEFLAHTKQCCEEVQGFYAEKEKRVKETRPNLDIQRAKKYNNESNHHYLLRLRAEEEDRRSRQSKQAEAVQMDLANSEDLARRQREAQRHREVE